MPPVLRAYFIPSYDYFAVFPWASFLAFGISAGSILKQVRQERYGEMMQWATLAGFGLILGGQYFSNLPYSLYENSEFWLNSPALILIKLGCIFLLASVAFLWTRYGTQASWSWVRQLGTTSLLVYWVHIELVYGRWFYTSHNTMTVWQCVFWSVVLIVSMLGLSVTKTRLVSWWRERRELAVAA
jgi:peptidoglycan/LPS O-acetylase OafA/YrhL